MGPLSEVVPEVMPEQVVQHGLGDPGGPHVGDVALLEAPLYPARLCGAGMPLLVEGYNHRIGKNIGLLTRYFFP